jgi:hypothetical protein
MKSQRRAPTGRAVTPLPYWRCFRIGLAAASHTFMSFSAPPA